MLLDQMRLFADYNAWANARLADSLADLDDDAYRRDGGVVFGSLHGTWNHLLVGDRMWFHRFGCDVEEVPSRLDQILYDDRHQLLDARRRMDRVIVDFVYGLDERDLERTVGYANSIGKRFAQKLAPLLAHAFNHQTHHRGQMHALLTGLGRNAPALDLIYYMREVE
ncbi:MAG: DinB family protein [Pseudomonadota bacterium]